MARVRINPDALRSEVQRTAQFQLQQKVDDLAKRMKGHQRQEVEAEVRRIFGAGNEQHVNVITDAILAGQPVTLDVTVK